MDKPAARRRRPFPLTYFLVALAISCSGRDAASPAPIATEPADEAPYTAVTGPAVAEPSGPAPLPPQAPTLAGRKICLDPGHDGYWVVGASGRTRGGTVPRHPVELVPLHEHELTLSVAYRLKALLESEGALVCVTRKPRDAGGGLQVEPYDYTGDGRVRTRGLAVEDEPERIQPRIDWANAFGAELLVSVHFNGLEDARARGTEVYYTNSGLRQGDARRLAAAVLTGLLAELRVSGYAAVDRGIKSDLYQRYQPDDMRRLLRNHAAVIASHGGDPANCGECYRLLTLGNNPMSLHAGAYLGVLVEVEFLSNPDVVEGLLLRPDSLDVIARGLLTGIRGYFETD